MGVPFFCPGLKELSCAAIVRSHRVGTALTAQFGSRSQFSYLFPTLQSPDQGELYENPGCRYVCVQGGEWVLVFIVESRAYLTHSEHSNTDGEQKAHPRV